MLTKDDEVVLLSEEDEIVIPSKNYNRQQEGIDVVDDE